MNYIQTMLRSCFMFLAMMNLVLIMHPAGAETLRPPAVPLITHDPYLSIWSEADKLTDDVTRHWTHRPHALISLIRVDGKSFRLMGNDPIAVPPMPQVHLEVLPTRSIYDFQDSKVHVKMTFMTTALPHDLDALSRPLSYITWQLNSVDGASHAVEIYESVSSELAVNTPNEKVVWGSESTGGMTSLHVGTDEQPVLQSSGDDIRINWGYAYLAGSSAKVEGSIGANGAMLNEFIAAGRTPEKNDSRFPRAVSDDTPVMALSMILGNVGAAPVSTHVTVAFDELYSIKYFGKKLRPYWRRNGASMPQLLAIAEREYSSLSKRCEQFDKELMLDMTKVGGERYAQICALSYRQALAGTGIAADENRQPLLFTKENTSNGDIATVDVIYPMEPIFLLLSPTLAKASLVSVLAYAASPHWKFPNAPHDLGNYPVVTGRDDGGEGMPVEESGNMLILCDAIAQAEGNADFVKQWWPQLTQWEKYLEKYGNDPEDQLCTDDFMGHLAHNSNLSVKAILAIGAYADLCRMRGDAATANRLLKEARGYARHWILSSQDGSHSRLAFDQANTWSQKYNLVWDKILGLNIFPPTIARSEIAFYKSVMQPYGVPLDSRTRLTKTDWSLWSATMASNQKDFDTFINPIYNYLNTTTARMPLVDSYITDNIKSDGMHARPVVGGLFIKMLSDAAVWKKWARGDHEKVGGWAALPQPPTVKEIVPTSRQKPVTWRYTFEKPDGNWTKPTFDASGWKEGPGGFGTKGTPGAVVNTIWNTADIWIRREFTMPNGNFAGLQFITYHDEDIEIYINGVSAAKQAGFITSYEPMEMNATARALLRPGAKITIAVHCHQTEGGQAIDVGIANVIEIAEK